MGFSLDFRPNEANVFCKPNEHLRFGYPVKNLDGTPYNEPLLTDVEVIVKPTYNNGIGKTFNFGNGTSHANGTNIIAFDLSITDSELPIGKYTWTINHKRTINAVVENNIMFEGSFEVTTKHRESCDIVECNVGNISIVNVDGLREELDLMPKFFSISFNSTLIKNITVSDGLFTTRTPIVFIYNGVLFVKIENITIVSDTSLDVEGVGLFTKIAIIY